LNHGHGVDADGAGFARFEAVFDEVFGFDVEVRDVGCDGGLVEGGGGAFAAAL
jgi:hypothetical protein